ncbi:nose resistant to fluoxetine protein 6-like [Littorina saxatilis]|uniref:nose resistant to fluoxetine protein 6-like n=1 Tax=Littorina saxatilis TaxID=31220 RepID=UPI0038B4ABBC
MELPPGHTLFRGVYFSFIVYFLITGTFCGEARVTAADDTSNQRAPLNSLRRTLAFVSSGLDKQQTDRLKALQKSVLNADHVKFAKDVLELGVLDNLLFEGFSDDERDYGEILSVEVSANTSSTPSNNLTTSSDNITTPSYLSTSSDNLTTEEATTTSPANVTTPRPLPPVLVNHKCVNHTAAFVEALVSRQPWAIQMIDADGKPGPNLEGFQLFWLGDYEECTKVVAIVNGSSGEDNTLFKGRYCTAIFPFQPTDVHPLIPAVAPSGLRVGLCVPDSCTGNDITVILDEVLASRNISFRVGLTTCQEESVDYDAKAIVVLFICSVFLLLMVIGTVFDVVVVQWPKWREASELGVDSQSLANNGYNSIGAGPTTSVNVKRDEETQPLLSGGKAPAGTDEQGLGKLAKAALAFSVYTNGKKILTAVHSPGSITCIHGIRFVSMTWVILGHTYIYGMTTAANYVTYLKNSMGLWSFQAVTSAPVTVDTFFVLSGLLVTYLILKEMDRRDGKVQWFLFYFHRFWRLTPPYAFVMMLYIPLFPYLASGPNWPQEGTELNYCRDTWWTNLLYVNNFVKVKEMCMAWSWYLSNDMQFYVISPLIFVPLFFWRRVGVVLACLWLLAAMVTAGVISKVNNFPPSIGMSATNIAASPDYFLDFYIKPYCRVGPYVVGMLAGYALYVTKCKVRMNLLVSLSGWAIATGVGLAVVYGLHGAANGHPLSEDTSAFYNALHHTAWGACVSWVIFACATGHGGPVNTFLSWSAFIPLSRLTYMAYLVHPIIMTLFHLSAPNLFYMSNLNCAMAFLSFSVASFAVAFVLSLAFEAPMMGLEKVMLSRQRKP